MSARERGEKKEAVVEAAFRLIRSLQHTTTDDFLRGDIRGLVDAVVTLGADVVAGVIGQIAGAALNALPERK
jgi:GTPase